jgi:hypothetical protein
MTRPGGAVPLTMRCMYMCMYSGASDDVTEAECPPGHAPLPSLTPGRCVRGKGRASIRNNDILSRTRTVQYSTVQTINSVLRRENADLEHSYL